MSTSAFITRASELPRPLNVVGEMITVLAGGDATGGYELFLQEGRAGQGPPPHSHDWSETFYVLAGEIEIAAGDRSAVCRAGDIAHAPAGVAHWFRFLTDGKMVSVTSRPGASKFFADMDRDAPGQPTGPEGLAPVMAVANRHGISIAAPAGA
jgi:quercetin dioxygenase-like cupin family protein